METGLVTRKNGDSPIKLNVTLGPQTLFVAKLQSSRGLYNWTQTRGKWQNILHGAEEEHGKECPWQLGAMSESVECEEGQFII